MSAKASSRVPGLFAQRLDSPNRDVRQTMIQHLLTRSLPRSQQMFIQARRCPSPVADRTQANQHMEMIMTTISRAARRDNVAGSILMLGTALRNGWVALVDDISRRANHGLAPALEPPRPAGRDGCGSRCSSFLLVAYRAVPAIPHDMVMSIVTQVTGAPTRVGYGSDSRSFAR
jgi:hypothetical protein